MVEENGFHLNTDSLETNLINIILLIALLIFSFAEPIKTGLAQRQAKITEKLDTAANYLIMANFRHKEKISNAINKMIFIKLVSRISVFK